MKKLYYKIVEELKKPTLPLEVRRQYTLMAKEIYSYVGDASITDSDARNISEVIDAPISASEKEQVVEELKLRREIFKALINALRKVQSKDLFNILCMTYTPVDNDGEKYNEMVNKTDLYCVNAINELMENYDGKEDSLHKLLCLAWVMNDAIAARIYCADNDGFLFSDYEYDGHSIDKHCEEEKNLISRIKDMEYSEFNNAFFLITYKVHEYISRLGRKEGYTRDGEWAFQSDLMFKLLCGDQKEAMNFMAFCVDNTNFTEISARLVAITQFKDSKVRFARDLLVAEPPIPFVDNILTLLEPNMTCSLNSKQLEMAERAHAYVSVHGIPERIKYAPFYDYKEGTSHRIEFYEGLYTLDELKELLPSDEYEAYISDFADVIKAANGDYIARIPMGMKINDTFASAPTEEKIPDDNYQKLLNK